MKTIAEQMAQIAINNKNIKGIIFAFELMGHTPKEKGQAAIDKYLGEGSCDITV